MSNSTSSIDPNNPVIDPSPAPAPSTPPLTTELPIDTPSTVIPDIPASSFAPSTVQSTFVDIVTTVKSNTSKSVVTTQIISTFSPTTTPPAPTPTTITTSSTAPSTALHHVTSSPTSDSDAQEDGGGGGGGGGLHGTSKVVVAVVVPVVAVALIAAGLLFWWKRRQKKATDLKRKSQMEDFSFRPNGGAAAAGRNSDGDEEMTESGGGGYRGWGSTNGGSKVPMGSSVTSSQPLSSPTAMGFMDPGYPNGGGPVRDSFIGMATSPTVSSFPPSTDGNLSSAPLVRDRSDTADTTIYGMPGAGVHRGDSNASSNYSAVTRSDGSESGYPAHYGEGYYGRDGAVEGSYNYSEQPYGGVPIIQEVPARRQTQIQASDTPHYPQRVSSGIAQNF